MSIPAHPTTTTTSRKVKSLISIALMKTGERAINTILYLLMKGAEFYPAYPANIVCDEYLGEEIEGLITELDEALAKNDQVLTSTIEKMVEKEFSEGSYGRGGSAEYLDRLRDLFGDLCITGKQLDGTEKSSPTMEIIAAAAKKYLKPNIEEGPGE